MNRRAQVLALLEKELHADGASGETHIRAEDVRVATIASLGRLDGSHIRNELARKA